MDRYQWAFDQDIPNPTAKAVLVALVHCDGRNAKDVYPSQATLADMTGFSPRAVWQALRLLEMTGWIERQRQHARAGNRMSDRFKIRQPGEGLLAPAASRLLAAGAT